MPKYAFKFISGKYQGGEFPIPDSGELVIGRAPDLDITLVEDMVSRKHAKLEIGQQLVIVDLGSTNGTFVNGEKVERAQLKRDDRVLIGTSILRLTALDRGRATAPVDTSAARENLSTLGKRAPTQTSSMSGDLEEVPLPDLLQLFATNKKSGVLSLTGSGRGRIVLKEGAVHLAALQAEPDMPPMKVMCRLLDWKGGQFQFDSTAALPDAASQFGGSTESVLMEALRQNDEAHRLAGACGGPEAPLRLARPIGGRLSELSAEELDVLQAAIDEGTVGALLDHAAQPDHALLVAVQKLLKAGILTQ